MTKTYLAIAFLITGFLVGDAYGERWDNELAKSLGIPLIPVGTVIMCEPKKTIGFNWMNGTYEIAVFKEKKHIFKKIEKTECSSKLINEPGFTGEISSSRNVCMLNYIFGENPAGGGRVCEEKYYKPPNGNWSTSFRCEKDLGMKLLGQSVGGEADPFYLSANGIYHHSFIHTVTSRTPARDHKDSQYIEWGICATISP
jgi:hypothetical protein